MKQTIKAVKLLQKEMISNPNIDRKLINQLQNMIDRSCYENKMEETYADRNPSAWLASQVDLSLCMTKDDY